MKTYGIKKFDSPLFGVENFTKLNCFTTVVDTSMYIYFIFSYPVFSLIDSGRH